MVELDVSTHLAFERTRAAYDRTMMAWIRTGTSLISFGFGIYKFFQLDLGRVRPPNSLIGPREFALLMVGLGVLSLVLGTLEHWKNMRSMGKKRSDIPRSWAALIAMLLSALGVFTFILVIFRE
ncbi:MAG: DUF202 domain-containing protein [Acidobacteriaceae bacterium]|nr:DUF202 domain-containing protein [Acidobacteriaceae bacterium]MBV9497786.1 DUF202 domain-containing protein [Acidobacteriaceae bacterium]